MSCTLTKGKKYKGCEELSEQDCHKTDGACTWKTGPVIPAKKKITMGEEVLGFFILAILVYAGYKFYKDMIKK
tara:strand:- start:5795 stop:6013 length:219 start_codon:yes stop_codon:yes gene_type:complete